MTPNEKALIEDLFNRLRTASPQGRDAEAEAAIAAEMARSPGAAYALVQTVLVQDQALHEAHDKLQAAEEAASRQVQQPQPSFLERGRSALAGYGSARPEPAPPMQQEPAPMGNPGGGFMRNALQTAAGVAGGALLFEGVRSMFGGSGGGGGLLGGGPWGQPSTTVNETIINEGAGKADSASADADTRNDNVSNADYDPTADDDGYDDGSSDAGDDSWV